MGIGLTESEKNAIGFIVVQFSVANAYRSAVPFAMRGRLLLARDVYEYCVAEGELPSDEDRINAVMEILYDFLVIETHYECRGLLEDKELARLTLLRTLFVKILVNAKVNGREMNFGSIYLAPAELVKIGLHKMLQFPEIELLHYARKADGGMLRVIAQFLWHRDYGTKDKPTVH